MQGRVEGLHYGHAAHTFQHIFQAQGEFVGIELVEFRGGEVSSSEQGHTSVISATSQGHAQATHIHTQEFLHDSNSSGPL